MIDAIREVLKFRRTPCGAAHHHYASFSSRVRLLALSGLLVWSAADSKAQRTTIEKNGTGGRIETDYNVAGKATEMRTIGADGKLQQKSEYEYRPGYYTAQQTDTTYWPNGRVRKKARHTYDESANFTGEFIEVFNDSGIQIAGHKLTHDPWTGVYRCSEWNVAAHDYRAVECPAGEEDRDAPEELKTFTYDEVMKNLDRAREAAQRQQTMRRAQCENQPSGLTDTTQREVGLVLPAHVVPGERVSGRLVMNPERYSETLGVTVTRVPLTLDSSGQACRLSGWLYETEGEKARPADGPVTLVVPKRESGLKITFREARNPAHNISLTLNFDSRSEHRPSQHSSFESPALCMKGELCMVSGPFDGDSTNMFAAFEDQPATVVAENSSAAYIDIPELAAPGSRPLFIADAMKVVAFPVTVGEFVVKNDGRELQAGQTLITFPTLEGLEDIPEPAWQVDGTPVASLERARQLIPGFVLSPEDTKDREGLDGENGGSEKKQTGEKKQQGQILLIVQNHTPEQISLRNSKNEMLVFHLKEEGFRRGEFKYDLVVEAKKAGKVDVKGYVIPFLAPVAGQEFRMKTTP